MISSKLLKIAPIMIGLILATSVAVLYAGVYKCKDPKGKYSYTDKPCKYKPGSVRVPLSRKIVVSPLSDVVVNSKSDTNNFNRAVKQVIPDYDDK